MQENSQPKVFIIVLNFNGKYTLPACLSSVFKSDYSNFEVVVVDNNSKDSSFEQAKSQFSRAHLIQNSANTGFGAGNNIGIRYALEKFADYVFILNNDTLIKRDTVSKLVNLASSNNSIGIVSPLIFNKKSVWFAGGKIDWLQMRALHIFKPQSKNPYLSQYLSGCAMLVKKEVFKKIGLFDERFFLYYEDTDLSFRAAKAGFELLVDPSTYIQHLEQSSYNNPKKNYWLVLSGLIFFRTHSSFAQKVWLFHYLTARKIKNFYDLISSENPLATEVRRAYVDFKKIPRY